MSFRSMTIYLNNESFKHLAFSLWGTDLQVGELLGEAPACPAATAYVNFQGFS